MNASLADRLRGSPFQGYAYAYPHKTAYRALNPSIALRDAWKDEIKSSLFLYVHIPFCEMRCGFCNLFTQAHSRSGLNDDLQHAYISVLERQAKIVRDALGDVSFSRIAVGGGTPTFLNVRELERLFGLTRKLCPASTTDLSISVEASPFTATPERLAVLRNAGVTRLSLGVQSFVQAEANAAGRAQSVAEVQTALKAIRDAKFPMLNIDLIYGLPGQSVDSWLESLRAALMWAPEELYLYPLYVRPMTGLGRRQSDCVMDYAEEIPPLDGSDALKQACLRAAMDLLAAENYEMLSMRHFRKRSTRDTGSDRYSCQEDGMVGIGCGSRSYTRSLHYSTEYAVTGNGVGAIIDEYISASDADFSVARYGFILNENEQRRRYLIKSLLRREGLDLNAYRAYFGTDAIADVPQLRELIEHNMVAVDARRWMPNPRGLAYSDVIGPWLASQNVRERMQAFALR